MSGHSKNLELIALINGIVAIPSFISGVGFEMAGIHAPAIGAALVGIGIGSAIFAVYGALYWYAAIEQKPKWYRFRFHAGAGAATVGIVTFIVVLMIAPTDPQSVIVAKLDEILESKDKESEPGAKSIDVPLLPAESQIKTDIGTYVPEHGSEAHIVVVNNKAYPINVEPVGFLTAATVPLKVSPAHPIWVKWQGNNDRVRRIPAGGYGVLHVVAFGMPDQVHIPLLGAFGWDRCLNFLLSETQKPRKIGYLAEGCQFDLAYDGNNEGIEIEFTLHLYWESAGNSLDNGICRQQYLVTPGDSREEVGFVLVKTEC